MKRTPQAPTNKKKDDGVDSSVFSILREIPSAIKTAKQIEEERRYSLETKSRKSEISRIYNEQRLMSIASSSKPRRQSEILPDPVVRGPASLNICSEIGVDQLCCQYNEDFSIFATGGADSVVRIFDTRNNNLIRTIHGGKDTEGFTSCVTCIKHKPVLKPDKIDNHFIFTYVNGIVKCFDYNTGECIFTINEKRQTYGVALHPRLHKFITYGDDLKINFYDYETQVKERTFKRSGRTHEVDGHTSRVFAARFNPASNAEFLSGGWDQSVLLWDLRKPHATRHISGVNLCGEGLDIDKMGRQVLTCSWRKEDQLQLWDYSTFKLISSITPDSHNSKLYCGRFLGPDFITCGGSDPSILRVVEKRSEQSRVVIEGVPSDVYHLTLGKIKNPASREEKKKHSKTEDQRNPPPDLTRAPSILFVAGPRIYNVDFCK